MNPDNFTYEIERNSAWDNVLIKSNQYNTLRYPLVVKTTDEAIKDTREFVSNLSHLDKKKAHAE